MSMLASLTLAALFAVVPQDPRVEDLSTRELVEALPGRAEERVWDREAREYVVHPAAEELERRLEAGTTLSDDEWRTALLRSECIRHRPRWPESTPFAISMRIPHWLETARVTARPRREGLEVADAGYLMSPKCGTFAMSSTMDALYRELGSLPPGEHQLVFDVMIERGCNRSKWIRPPSVLWEGTLVLDTEIVSSVDEAVPPATGAELDEAVRASIGLLVKPWARKSGGSPEPTAILVVDPDTATFPELGHTALSLAVDVLCGEDVVATTDLLASSYDPLRLMSCTTSAPRRYFAFGPVPELPPEVDDGATFGWALRVRGTSKSVQAIWNADQRWAGSVTVPVQEALERERQRAPARRWSYFPSRF